jgi:alpha-mannosidase
MTAFKKAEERDTAILRFYNTANKTITLTAEVSPAFKAAKLTNLDEAVQSELTLTDGKLVMEIPAKKIITVELA